MDETVCLHGESCSRRSETGSIGWEDVGGDHQTTKLSSSALAVSHIDARDASFVQAFAARAKTGVIRTLVPHALGVWNNSNPNLQTQHVSTKTYVSQEVGVSN